MTYEQINRLKPADFKRLCGVSKDTFDKMCEIVRKDKQSNSTRGRRAKLSLENQVLLTLCFWREDRTQYHLGTDWNLHESNVSRTVRRIEDILIKSGEFSLPGKKQLPENTTRQFVIVDVTESPVERPKKNNVAFIAERKSDTHRKLS